MNQPHPYSARQGRSAPQGVPVAYALIGAAVTLLVGLYLGKTSAPPAPPVPAEAAQDSAGEESVSTKFDPRMSARLAECKAEKKDLLAALGRDERQESTPVSHSGASSSSTPVRGPSLTERRADKPADVQVWAARVEMLGNGPHMRANGKINNRESKVVEGVLRVTLIRTSGEAVDEASIPMMLDPGLNAWEYVFRWAPDGKYRAEAEWQTLTL